MEVRKRRKLMIWAYLIGFPLLFITIIAAMFWVVWDRGGAPTIAASIIAILLITLTLISIGLGMFAMRTEHRFAYGAIEASVAVVMMLFSTGLVIDTFDQPKTSLFLAMPSLLPFMASVYVFVRGMDNMLQGTDAKSRFQRVWQWMSGGKA